MKSTGKAILVIWFMVVMYVIVIDPDLIDLNIGSSGSGGVADVSDYVADTTVTCMSDKYVINCETSAIIRERSDIVQEDSFPSMIPEFEVPMVIFTDEDLLYITYALITAIVIIVVAILWKKSKPVIEMGEQ